MFSLNNQLELRKVTVSSLITCVYLPSIVTVVSYKGLLYSVGKVSSVYILVLIYLAELLKSFYLSSFDEGHLKKSKQNKNRAREMAKSFITLLTVVSCFFVGIILFGAPFLDNHEETLMLSALLTLLTVFPLLAHSGLEASMQLMFGAKGHRDAITGMLLNNATFAVGGAWLGAVVIPLDWNTPWQVWPIPCYLGAIGGYLLSNVLTVSKVALLNAAHKYPTANILFNMMNKIRVSK